MSMLHATAVAIDGAGILIRGPSGSGKSDLALRLIDRGAVLVADDYVEVEARDYVLHAAPPARLAGLIEIRGLGPMRQPFCCAELVLVVDLVPTDEVERLPEPRTAEIEAVALPCVKLCPFEASTAAKVALALAQARTGAFVS